MTAAPLSMVAMRMSWPEFGREGRWWLGGGGGVEVRSEFFLLFLSLEVSFSLFLSLSQTRTSNLLFLSSLSHTWAVHERHVPQQLHPRPFEPRSVAGRSILLRRPVGLVAPRPRAVGVGRPVDLGVGVPQLDRDVPLELVLEADGLHARDGFNDCGLAVGDVADGSLGKGGRWVEVGGVVEVEKRDGGRERASHRFHRHLLLQLFLSIHHLLHLSVSYRC